MKEKSIYRLQRKSSIDTDGDNGDQVLLRRLLLK